MRCLQLLTAHGGELLTVAHSCLHATAVRCLQLLAVAYSYGAAAGQQTSHARLLWLTPATQAVTATAAVHAVCRDGVCPARLCGQGFCDLHEKYGKLPWAELFGPVRAFRRPRAHGPLFGRVSWGLGPPLVPCPFCHNLPRLFLPRICVELHATLKEKRDTRRLLEHAALPGIEQAIEYALRGFAVTEYIGDQYARGWGEAVATDKGCSNARTLGGQHPAACAGFLGTFTVRVFIY